jgi:hypothetical protein
MRVHRSLILVPALLLTVGLTGCGAVEEGALRAGDAGGAAGDPSGHPAGGAATADHSPADVAPWPQDVDDPQLGGHYVAIYLGGDQDAPEVLARHGYTVVEAEASCLQGMEAAEHLPAYLSVPHLLFADQAGADAFLEAYQTTDPGVVASSVPVTTYCLDDAAYDEDRDAGVDEDQAGPPLPGSVQQPVQGGSYGLVVLTAGDQSALDASQDEIRRLGDTAYVGEVGCYQGAAEALGLADGTLVSSLLFDDVATAQQFDAAYGSYVDTPTVGVAAVTAYCLD